MKRTLLSLAVGLGLSLFSVCAQAQFTLQVSNFTFSGGDPIFPITNDVTFTNLLLTEKFTDNSTTTIPLFDPNHTATNTVDTGTLFLETDPLGLGSPTHGAATNFTLTGAFDLTNLDISTAFGGSTTNVNVNPNFMAILGLPTTTGLVNIDAIDAASGQHYGAGTLALLGTPGGSVVPEPGAFAFAVACGLGAITTFARRKRAKRV